VFRDHNGVAYLRVRAKKGEGQFVVNKGFQVELITIDDKHAAALNLQPVVGASIYEAARRLFTPLNDQVTISIGAREVLQEVLNKKEIETMATKTAAAVAPAKKAKFATTSAAPAPAPAKAAKKTAAEAPAAPAAPAKKAAKKTAAAAESNGSGRESRYTADQKIILLQKENPRREGTKAYDWFELYRVKGQTVGGYLEAGGDRGYLINDAEKRGLIQIK
jgi:hypothetical protein